MGCGASTQAQPTPVVDVAPTPAAEKPAAAAEKPAPAAAAEAEKPAEKPATVLGPDGYADDKQFENGHAQLADAFAGARSKWAEMNGKATPPEAGATFLVAMIADQDQASRLVDGEVPKWKSALAHGRLTYHGALGDKSYSLAMEGEHTIYTTRGDKAGRGAEYSALEVFCGKLLTMDDRTGNVDEITSDFEVVPLIDAEGAPVVMKLGDGKKEKPLKCEWTTQRGGKLVIGSTGKERTDDDSKVVHHGEMWLKTLEPDTFACTHVDGTPSYNGIRAAASVGPAPEVGGLSQGYMIHESGRWSEEHAMWFFMPRKLSRQSYDEVVDAGKCVNLMLASNDPVAEDGSGVIMQPYLGFLEQRGASDFLFVPGSKDCHVFIIRTEESLDGVISTFSSVIDLEGNTLMAETAIGEDRKFEGAAWVNGFGGFEGEPQPPSAGDCVIA